MDAAKQIHLIAKGNKRPSPHPDKTSVSSSEKLSAVSSRIRQVFQVRSGWAVLTADSETRDFLVEKQAEWAAELGATTVETNKEWFTYVVSDFPTRLTDFHGKEVESDNIVSDEIEIQTGLKPVDIRPSRQFSDNPLTKTLLVSFLKPTKRFWSLFGSSAARLIDKTDRPRQYSQFANAVAPTRPTFVGAQLGRRECTACSADSLKSNENISGPLAQRHTDNDTWHNNQSRIWKPNKARLSYKGTMPHHTNSLAYSQTRKDNKKPLRIFQANVGKIPPAHDCALALADSERYDIVLLQEPWTAHTDTRSLTKTHPAYDTFTPVETWDGNDTRPRVMTYVRRDPRLLADQIRPFQTRDILWLTINGMTIVNFYRQNDESDALNILIRWPVPERCLIAGDFNARHHTWQTGQATNRGQEIADWASENDLDLLNTPDIPTNPHGNTIDLAFT
ncbi:reverse transcriptase, partial [Fusarium beomiforme]